MGEIFSASEQLLHALGLWVGVGLSIIALTGPVLALVARLGTAFASLRLRHGSSAPAPAGLDQALQGQAMAQLDATWLAFALETRMLLRSMEPSLHQARRWSERKFRGPLTRWLTTGSESDGEQIASRGDIWRWLVQAETLVEANEQRAPLCTSTLGARARTIRSALFGAQADQAAPRLAEVFALLLNIDRDLHALERTPYRGPRVASPASPDDASENVEPASARFAQVMHQHQRAIRSIARRYANDDAGSEDLEQEIYLALLTALPRHRGDASLKTYVLRIAHYCGARFGRRQFRYAPFEEERASARGVDGQSDPHAHTLHRERQQHLYCVLQDLPQGQRDAIARYLEGKSYREIAGELQIEVKTVSARITRARQSLARRLRSI